MIIEILALVSVVLLALLSLCAYVSIRLKHSLTASLEREEQVYEEFLDYPGHNPHPVLHISKLGMVLYGNPASKNLLREWNIKVNDKLPSTWREISRQVQMSDQSQFVELQCGKIWYSLNIVPLPNGNVNMFAIDISEQKRKETELMERTTRDEITHLPNRLMFQQNLSLDINYAKTGQEKLGVVVIRLDDYFEIINTYGPDIGKDFTLQFCERLKLFASGESSLARLSDNEFGMLVQHIKDPAAMSSHIQSLIENCTAKYTVQDKEIFITLSIGIAFYPSDADTANDLIRNAQLAVNRTSSTRNQFEFFQRGMIEQLQVKRNIIADLHKALQNHEFELYYQPQIHLRTMSLQSCEALIRWKHPQKGFISPFFFITAAEETQLIIPIGEWVLRQACQQIKKWQTQRFPRLPNIKVSVNVSARQLFQSDIVGLVQKVLAETKLGPEYLELELTESALVQDIEKATSLLKELKKIGVTIALDDFGTGYSSLSYLLQFPVDTLKIDRSFIKVIESEQQKSEMIKGIIDLGHSLNLTIVAEGAETKTQVRFLKQQGCDLVQGYFFSQPQPVDKFEEFFRKDWKI